MEILLLAVSFAILLAGALFFTNAVEWIGHKLEMGEGAVGSLLAAVGTAMPETLIPIVAIIGGTEGSEDVAIGAIIGAPFLLATLAMAIVGISAHVWKGKRDQGLKLNADIETLDRDLIFFLIFFALALLAGLVLPDPLHIPAAIGLPRRLRRSTFARTLRGGGDVQEIDTSTASTSTARPGSEPPMWLAIVQFVVSLGAIVGGAHLFVEEMIKVAEYDRRRAARALPDPRPARDRAAGEDQQHLLGPRGQGQPRPRQHHRRDGLPVDDPDRRRPRCITDWELEPLRGRLGHPRPAGRRARLLDAASPRPLRMAAGHRLAILFFAFLGYVLVS